jgi:hypothetical protein
MQDFNEFIARSDGATASLSERDVELLLTLGTFILAVALLPEAAAATSVLATLAAVGSVFGIGTSFGLGLILAFDALGVIRLNESEFDGVKLTNHLAGNMFTVLGGTLGFAVDGEYGMQTGITGGELTGIMFDGSDTIKAVMELKDFRYAALHIVQLAKELKELPSTSEGEHGRVGQHSWHADLNAESITKDMIYQITRIARPITQKATDQPPARPAEDNAASQVKRDRSFYGMPQGPTYPPSPAPATQAPLPFPGPPSAPPSSGPPAALAPKPPPPSAALRSFFPGNLMPSYLGGTEPSESPPEVPSIPDAPEPGPQIPGPS